MMLLYDGDVSSEAQDGAVDATMPMTFFRAEEA
jgi:hypothetical protein